MNVVMSPRAWSNAFALAAVLVSRAARALAPAAKQAHPLFALSASQTPKSVNRVLRAAASRVARTGRGDAANADRRRRR